MLNTIGFLGCGNMGGAIARAVCKAADPQNVWLANRTAAKAEALAAELGCNTTINDEVAGRCDLIFLAVKPPDDGGAAGTPLRFTLAERPNARAVQHGGGPVHRPHSGDGGRRLPRHPHHAQHARFGRGRYDTVLHLQRHRRGRGRVPEADGPRRAAGCCAGGPHRRGQLRVRLRPAWVYQFIEALADGGVACGLRRAKAQEYAAQMVLGSAKLVLESSQHPGAHQGRRVQPGGSTIQGVQVLEERPAGRGDGPPSSPPSKTKEMGKGLIYAHRSQSQPPHWPSTGRLNIRHTEELVKCSAI